MHMTENDTAGEIFGSLSDFDFEISILSLTTLIGLPLDIISKCKNILSKPTEPKVSSDPEAKTQQIDISQSELAVILGHAIHLIMLFVDLLCYSYLPQI